VTRYQRLLAGEDGALIPSCYRIATDKQRRYFCDVSIRKSFACGSVTSGGIGFKPGEESVYFVPKKKSTVNNKSWR
jgi:hypothetical protein